MVGTLYDGQLDKIEEESEANTDAHDSEIERIELLKEQKIISEEEAQARKRAAEDKTRKKEEELEKRRQDIQYKQAVWDKAANIANASIATALAITEALPNFVLAALVGAMGAVQLRFPNMPKELTTIQEVLPLSAMAARKKLSSTVAKHG